MGASRVHRVHRVLGISPHYCDGMRSFACFLHAPVIPQSCASVLSFTRISSLFSVVWVPQTYVCRVGDPAWLIKVYNA
jgi:hypothetical protein